MEGTALEQSTAPLSQRPPRTRRRCCEWWGHIIVLGPRRRCRIFIGPHWYFSILMLAFIEWTGCSYTKSCAASVTHTIISIVITVLSTLTFLRCAFADPGVVRPSLPSAGASDDIRDQQEPVSDPEEGDVAEAKPPIAEEDGERQHDARELTSGPGHHCSVCDVTQPRNTVHCFVCGVCVKDWDHHCPWMGKCIGGGNICEFYTFLVVGFASLGYMLIGSLMDMPSRVQTTPIPPS